MEEEKSRQSVTDKLAGRIPLSKFLRRTFRRKDGIPVLVSVEEQLLRDSEGKIVGIRSTIQDITEHNRMEEALRQSEGRYRTLVEESFDGIFVQRGNKIIFANKRLYEMLGYDKGQLEGLDHWLVYHPDYQNLTRERAQARMRGEEVPSQYQVKLQRKDGSSFDGEINARKIMFGDDPGIQVWVRDITELKQDEEKINNTLSLLNATMESTADGILVVDKNGKIAGLNKRFVQMWCIPESIIASRDDDLALEYVLDQLKNPQDFLAKVRELYDQPDAESFDTLEFKDGRIFERYSKPQRLGDQIVGRVWSFRDVTERKHAEAQMIESEERYRTAIEHSNDGVAIVRGGEHLYVNKRFVEIFDYDRSEEIIGKQHSITVHPDDLGKVMEFNTRRQRGESVPDRYEFKGIRKDGTAIYIEVSATQTVYRGESVSLAYLRDITERKQAETEREKTICELKEALDKVKLLSGMLPICASCKNIRDDKGYWTQIETYIRSRSEAEFSHGICPECVKKLYPEEYLEDL